MPTNRPHRPVCTHYMRAPAVGNDVVPLAIHAAQSHDIINNTIGLSWQHGDIVPNRGYPLHGVYALLMMSSIP